MMRSVFRKRSGASRRWRRLGPDWTSVRRRLSSANDQQPTLKTEALRGICQRIEARARGVVPETHDAKYAKRLRYSDVESAQ